MQGGDSGKEAKKLFDRTGFSMARLVVTGANGFVGRHLVPLLIGHGHQVTEAGRSRGQAGEAAFVDVGEIGPATEWTEALRGADAVIHLAGLAHREDVGEDDFLLVNDAGTRRLIEACEAADIKAVVALSSIAAREAERGSEQATAYGRSKLASEAHVRRYAQHNRPGIVLRPPLVYGHDAPGNWARLQKLAATGMPLPLGAVRNRRSMCSVDNLCDAIAQAVEAAMAGQGSGVYEICDRETVSLTEILVSLRAGMGRPRRLMPVPSALLRAAATAAGHHKLVSALLDDLVLDPSAFMGRFSWVPPESAREGIARSGRLYAERGRTAGRV